MSRIRFPSGGVNSRWTRSSCTSDPALQFKPCFFECSDQSRCCLAGVLDRVQTIFDFGPRRRCAYVLQIVNE